MILPFTPSLHHTLTDILTPSPSQRGSHQLLVQHVGVFEARRMRGHRSLHTPLSPPSVTPSFTFTHTLNHTLTHTLSLPHSHLPHHLQAQYVRVVDARRVRGTRSFPSTSLSLPHSHPNSHPHDHTRTPSLPHSHPKSHPQDHTCTPSLPHSHPRSRPHSPSHQLQVQYVRVVEAERVRAPSEDGEVAIVVHRGSVPGARGGGGATKGQGGEEGWGTSEGERMRGGCL